MTCSEFNHSSLECVTSKDYIICSDERKVYFYRKSCFTKLFSFSFKNPAQIAISVSQEKLFILNTIGELFIFFVSKRKLVKIENFFNYSECFDNIVVVGEDCFWCANNILFKYCDCYKKIEKIFESEYTLGKIIKINSNSIYLSAFAKNNYYVMHLNFNNGVSLCNRINIKNFSFASQIVYNDISKSFYYIKKKSLFAVKEENLFKDKFIVDLISTTKWYEQLRIRKTTVSENGNFFVTTTEKSFSVFSTKDSSLLYKDKLLLRENHYLDNIFILESDVFLFSVSSYGFGGYTLVYNANTEDHSLSLTEKTGRLE